MDTLHCVQFSFLLTLTLSLLFCLSHFLSHFSLSPGLACHRSSCFPLYRYPASFCFRLFHDSLLSHLSLSHSGSVPFSTTLHHHTYYLGCTVWRCLNGVEVWADDAGVLAYVGVCPALSARPFTSGGHNCLAWCDRYQSYENECSG